MIPKKRRTKPKFAVSRKKTENCRKRKPNTVTTAGPRSNNGRNRLDNRCDKINLENSIRIWIRLCHKYHRVDAYSPDILKQN
jgi:hypothetical protein